jgi:hypothetical protein
MGHFGPQNIIGPAFSRGVFPLKWEALRFDFQLVSPLHASHFSYFASR